MYTKIHGGIILMRFAENFCLFSFNKKKKNQNWFFNSVTARKIDPAHNTVFPCEFSLAIKPRIKTVKKIKKKSS